MINEISKDTNIIPKYKNGKWGYVDKDGKEIFPFEYDYAGCFYDGVAVVLKDNIYMYIDKDNKVLKKSSRSLTAFRDGFGICEYHNSRDGKFFSCINTKGETLFCYRCFDLRYLGDNFFAIKQGLHEVKCLYYFQKKVVSLFTCVDIIYIGEGFFLIQETFRTGLTLVNRFMRRYAYDIIFWNNFTDGIASFGMRDGTYKHINKYGEFVNKPKMNSEDTIGYVKK